MVTWNSSRMLVSFKATPIEYRPPCGYNRWTGMLVSLEANALEFQKELYMDCFVVENTLLNISYYKIVLRVFIM